MPTKNGETLRSGVARLLGWLTSQPNVQVDAIEYCDPHDADIILPSGQAGALDRAADVADTLDAPVIQVVRQAVKKTTTLQISGRADGGAGAINLVATAVVDGPAETALLDTLPPRGANGDVPTVSATELRTLAKRLRSAPAPAGT